MWNPPPLLPAQNVSWEPRPEDPDELYLQILRREDKPERLRGLAWSLGRQKEHAKALTMAQRLAADPDPAFRCLGVVALVELHDQGLREAERALVRLTTDPDERVRATIPYELRFKEDQESTAILLRLARDPSALVRSHVARGIHLYSHPDAKASYLALLVDPEPSVRAAAVDNSSAYEDGLKEPWPEVFALWTDPSEDVRRLITYWIQELPPEQGVPMLLELSRDPSADVRASAIARLRWADTPGVLARLLEAAIDDSDSVRIEALDLLMSKEGDEVTAALLHAAKDPNSTVRKLAAQGLVTRATLGMLPVLESLAEDEANMHTRNAAARALDTLRSSEAELILTAMLRDPSKMVQRTVRKIFEQWSKEGPIAKNTGLALRHGPIGARATRDAFLAGGRGSLKSWEAFVARTQTLDGVASGDTDHGPAVVMTAQDGVSIGLMPFGPAHWIRLSHMMDGEEVPRMSFALLTNREVAEWFKASPPRRVRRGRKILQRYAWE